MTETLIVHIERGENGHRFQVDPTGKVIAFATPDGKLREVWTDLALVGFAKTFIPETQITVKSIDYTIDDLFEVGMICLSSYPIMKSFGSIYAINMPVKHIEPAYKGKHRKEGTPK